MKSMRSEPSRLLPHEQDSEAFARAEAASTASDRSLLRRLTPYLLVTLLANTAIAGMLSIALPQSHHTFLTHFVFSQFIGLSILMLVAVPRLTFWPRSRMAAWQAILHLALATVLGFVVGSFAASLLLDRPPLIGNGGSAGNVLPFVALVTVLASVGCSSFFWLRERVAALQLEASRERARAEAASRQAAEAQLNLLRTQLEPHMLFNTLANLRSLMTIDPPRAQLMVDRLISFLRATLAASRHGEVRLADEFAVVRDYLELMSIRMGPRLAFSLDLSQDLADLPVLPMLLQPLVENAVRHGIEPDIDGGRIDVRALVDEDRLVLLVEDTGIGLGPDGPASRGSADGGFGLAQIHERLATAYGDAATLVIEPLRQDGSDRRGTRAELTLPMPRLDNAEGTR
jgi:sensor histidine kinase YesM